MSKKWAWGQSPHPVKKVLLTVKSKNKTSTLKRYQVRGNKNPADKVDTRIISARFKNIHFIEMGVWYYAKEGKFLTKVLNWTRKILQDIERFQSDLQLKRNHPVSTDTLYGQIVPYREDFSLFRNALWLKKLFNSPKSPFIAWFVDEQWL